MREPKPEWSHVPEDVKQTLAARLGSPIINAGIAWGGYTPSASYLVGLADGRRVFLKGTHPEQNSHGVAAFHTEQGIYENYPLLKEVAPAYLGSVSQNGWNFMALEAIEKGEPVLPWNAAKLDSVFSALNRLAALVPAQLPELGSVMNGHAGWNDLIRDEVELAKLYQLFENPDAAREWFSQALPLFASHELRMRELGGRQQPLHVDLRSDNILMRADGRAVLLDWPNLCRGPVVYDICYFINSVVVDGYGDHEGIIAAAETVLGESFAQADWKISAAHISGYLALSCIRPEVPALPRLRGFQKKQFQVMLPWLRRLFGLKALPAFCQHTHIYKGVSGANFPE